MGEVRGGQGEIKKEKRNPKEFYWFVSLTAPWGEHSLPGRVARGALGSATRQRDELGAGTLTVASSEGSSKAG